MSISDDVRVSAAATETRTAEEACRAHTSMVLVCLNFFNFKFNSSKLEIEPRLECTFGGLVADSVGMTHAVTSARTAKGRKVWMRSWSRRKAGS